MCEWLPTDGVLESALSHFASDPVTPQRAERGTKLHHKVKPDRVWPIMRREKHEYCHGSDDQLHPYECLFVVFPHPASPGVEQIAPGPVLLLGLPQWAMHFSTGFGVSGLTR